MRLPPPTCRIVALAVAALAEAGCGKRGDPLPPLQRTPQAVTELALAQRGAALEIRVQAPRTTTEGERLGVVTLEILTATTDGDLAKVATRRQERAAPGERLVLTEELPAPGSQVRVAAVARSGKRASPQSAPRALKVADPVPAPRDLVAALQPEGVLLRFTAPDPLPAWIEPPKPAAPAVRRPSPAAPRPAETTAPPRGGAEPAAEEREAAATPTPSAPPPEPDVAGAGATAAATPEPEPTPAPAAGTRIYRRADPGSYAEPLRVELVRENVYLDSDAPMGRSACYVARTVVSIDPLIESEASNEACLEVQDRLPPAAPGGVATLSVEGGLEISWSPSGEADLESYRVYRVVGDEPPLLVAEAKPPETRVVDEAQPPAQRVHYFVTAVDAAGNESLPSPRVEGARR